MSSVPSRFRRWTRRLAILACGLACNAGAQDWDLVWSDEFDGPNIDLTKWEHEVNGWGGGNNELQYYTARPQNSFIQNGRLVIQALRETYTGPDGTRDYTSARLRTLNKGDWKYGRFEARIKLPTGQGLWPAFWMLPTDWVYGGWAASGEIDIVELLGQQPNKIYGTIHFGGEWPANGYSGGSYVAPSGDYTSGFHEFAMEWEPYVMRWYVDGVHYHTESNWYSTAAAYPAPFNQRFHLLLNVAVGGNWPGSPDASTVFPQRMEVDYVRVYKKHAHLGPPTPISATAPTRIQAEDYALGGEGIGYHDLDPGNTGGAYRSDDVDIEATSDTGGGHNVGWIQGSEWLAYPVNVAAPGLHTVVFRTASPGGGTFFLRRDGVAVTGTLSAPATGGWQTWTSVTRSNVFLTAGEQLLTFHTDTGNFNLNWMLLIPPAPGLDTDGDGIPDAWEIRYTGNPTSLVPGAHNDTDGASNFDEYIADTNPNDALSRLAMRTLSVSDRLEFMAGPASTARVYRLQMYTQETGSWTNLATGLTPTGTTLSVTHSNPAAPAAFYRVGVSVP